MDTEPVRCRPSRLTLLIDQNPSVSQSSPYRLWPGQGLLLPALEAYSNRDKRSFVFARRPVRSCPVKNDEPNRQEIGLGSMPGYLLDKISAGPIGSELVKGLGYFFIYLGKKT